MNRMIDEPRTKDKGVAYDQGQKDTAILAQRLSDRQNYNKYGTYKNFNDLARNDSNEFDETGPDTLDEFLFGDADEPGYPLEDMQNQWPKAYVQKIMLMLIIPLEKSYYDLKDAFMHYVMAQGISARDLPELSLSKCLKKVDLLYQKKGYEKVNYEGRQTLSNYKTTLKQHKMSIFFLPISY